MLLKTQLLQIGIATYGHSMLMNPPKGFGTTGNILESLLTRWYRERNVRVLLMRPSQLFSLCGKQIWGS
jgi:hypothetical protein